MHTAASQWNRRQKKSWARPLSHREGSAMGTPSLRCTDPQPLTSPFLGLSVQYPACSSSYLTPMPQLGQIKDSHGKEGGPAPPIYSSPNVTLGSGTSCPPHPQARPWG